MIWQLVRETIKLQALLIEWGEEDVNVYPSPAMLKFEEQMKIVNKVFKDLMKKHR